MFLRRHPELQPFVLTNVRPTGATLGAGAYGSVEEVAMPGAVCAAKKIHDIYLNPAKVSEREISEATAQFVRECKIMSTLRHPNIVQFLGLRFLPGSRLPALVMERLLTSLHDLLDPETDIPLPPDAPKPFFPAEPKVLDPAQRGERPDLPPRAIAAHHPPRLVGQKRSPELGDGGQDSGHGRGSYRASCASSSCSHHDKGTWCHNLHASRGHGKQTWGGK
ncbi:Putative serine/threonine-protein kinase/receptor R826 [Geodia barretti]|uniref:Serine/threonine-protein kinase/receptor R826 n=1 Tax=Geodia barretti TaxID=519541 RepID=A0AA35SWG1_GEOBA|nr:Putative serine/threonine-protein kinase/receptor R826 [Geodia barretti]